MINPAELLKQIKHALFITVPDNLWYQLYYHLQKYCAVISTNRQNTLIVTINSYQIKIDNLSHHNLVTIPIELDNLIDVTFTKKFQTLPIDSQNKIKDLIQQTITKSQKQRKKD